MEEAASLKSGKSILADYSLWIILFSNLIVIPLTLQAKNMFVFMYAYAFQGIIIGIFNCIRILRMDRTSSGESEEEKEEDFFVGKKIIVAAFFLAIYGVAQMMIITFTSLILSANIDLYNKNWGIQELQSIAFLTFSFFISHLLSFIYNESRDSKNQNIRKLLFFPFIRELPIFVTIIAMLALSLFPFVEVGGMIFLILFKTLGDVGMHIIEHRIVRKSMV